MLAARHSRPLPVLKFISQEGPQPVPDEPKQHEPLFLGGVNAAGPRHFLKAIDSKRLDVLGKSSAKNQRRGKP
jgi:hypothetical protein